MEQSTLPQMVNEEGLHVAIIMDGNGRWAANRGLPRTAGHREGAKALERVLDAAPRLNIRVLTVFALSSDNLHRPEAEVRALLSLLKTRLQSEMQSFKAHGMRLSVIGRRDRLPRDVLRAIEEAEGLTAECSDWRFRIALDYSSREAILSAARTCEGVPDLTQAAFSQLVSGCGRGETPEVDLLIRAVGEQRLSDFLLWESADAELYFSPILWPDFDGQALAVAVEDFHKRDRRFGRVDGAGGVDGMQSITGRS